MQKKTAVNLQVPSLIGPRQEHGPQCMWAEIKPAVCYVLCEYVTRHSKSVPAPLRAANFPWTADPHEQEY